MVLFCQKRTAFLSFIDRVDPGAYRRVKGLRLVTSFGIAAMLGTMGDLTQGFQGRASIAVVAGGIALWSSISEGRSTRWESSRDLLLLAIAAGLGATSIALLGPLLGRFGQAGPELLLVPGAFCVGYLRRFGITGSGLGSLIFIGQIIAYSAGLTAIDLPAIGLATGIAAASTIVQRLLSGPAERPPPAPPPLVWRQGSLRPELVMGLQGAAGALLLTLLNAVFGMIESVWAVTACTYVIAGSAHGTISRVARRILGTAVGVPIGLSFLPLADTAPVLAWIAAALAMVIYAMAMPERYDIACGAYAFTLIVTLAATGEHTVSILGARSWETVLGGAVGLAAALLLLPIREELTTRRTV